MGRLDNRGKGTPYRRMISSSRWIRTRREQLSRQPLCERCLKSGLYVSATEVHHITPCETSVSEAVMEQLMFSTANLQSLCHSCHVQTHVEMGSRRGSYVRERNRKQSEEAKRLLFGDDGDDDDSS